MNLDELRADLERISGEIDRLSIETGYEQDDYLSRVDINPEDSSELFLMDGYTRTIEKLWKLNDSLKRLNAPVIAAGELHRGENGRYSVNGYELSSGSEFEALIYDEGEKRNLWKAFIMEFDNAKNNYCTHGIEELEGLFVRIRRERA